MRGTEPRGRLRWRSNETRRKGRERRRICRRRRCDGIPIALASLTLDTSPPCRRCKAASQERSDRCRTAAAGTRASRRRRRAKLPRSRRRERCFFVFCFPHLSSRFRGAGELHCPKRVMSCEDALVPMPLRAKEGAEEYRNRVRSGAFDSSPGTAAVQSDPRIIFRRSQHSFPFFFSSPRIARVAVGHALGEAEGRRLAAAGLAGHGFRKRQRERESFPFPSSASCLLPNTEKKKKEKENDELLHRKNSRAKQENDGCGARANVGASQLPGRSSDPSSGIDPSRRSERAAAAFCPPCLKIDPNPRRGRPECVF